MRETMSTSSRYACVLRPSRREMRRDITAFVDAACVARAISSIGASSSADGPPQRSERERTRSAKAPAYRGEGFYEDGVWYEPAEAVRD
jgi:hypothetical protein